MRTLTSFSCPSAAGCCGCGLRLSSSRFLAAASCRSFALAAAAALSVACLTTMSGALLATVVALFRLLLLLDRRESGCCGCWGSSIVLKICCFDMEKFAAIFVMDSFHFFFWCVRRHSRTSAFFCVFRLHTKYKTVLNRGRLFWYNRGMGNFSNSYRLQLLSTRYKISHHQNQPKRYKRQKTKKWIVQTKLYSLSISTAFLCAPMSLCAWYRLSLYASICSRLRFGD